MRSVITLIIAIFLTSFVTSDDATYAPINKRNSFNKGEFLEYKAKLGLFTVARAEMMIYDQTYKVNGRDCYKLDVFGKTSGAVDWVANVDDNWGAFIDTAALIPHISYRNLSEGKYRKKEIVKFDHQSNMVEAKVLNNKTGEFKDPVYFKAPDNIRDIMAGYLWLRSLDYGKYRKGDTITVKAFFEDTFYDLKILFAGKDKVVTDAGKFRAIKLVPVMPDNKLFRGENSVTVWLSDDKNKIPIKAKAEMFIGSAECELTSYRGLKNAANRLN